MAPKSSDFVKDILQKSILQAIHVYSLLKTLFGTFLDPFGLSDDTQASVQRGVHEPQFLPIRGSSAFLGLSWALARLSALPRGRFLKIFDGYCII